MAKVLLVDDDVDIQEINQLILMRRGHQVKLAYSASEARTALDQERPDVVVLDVMMEETASGIDLAKEIHERFPDVAVIMLSGIRGKLDPAHSNLQPDVEGLPVVKFLDKPFSSEKLADEIEALVK